MGSKISKGTSTEEVRKLLSKYQGYLLGQGDPARIAAQAQAKDASVPLILVYGSKDGSTASFPISFGQRLNFKALSDAKNTEIKAANALKADANYDKPVVFFEYVTVKMK